MLYILITLYICDAYSMYIFMYSCALCIMVAFKQTRVFYGKINIYCGNCNIKQNIICRGADPNIWANFSQFSFLLYILGGENLILEATISMCFMNFAKNSKNTCEGVPLSVNLLSFLASKFTKMNFYTVIFKFFLFLFKI